MCGGEFRVVMLRDWTLVVILLGVVHNDTV